VWFSPVRCSCPLALARSRAHVARLTALQLEARDGATR